MTTTRVFCTTRFEAWHAWPNAPAECDYLQARHRHVFHVRAEKTVGHADRDIEFITLKHEVERTIARAIASVDTEVWSCEHWADWLLGELSLDRVEVSEDGENGAVVEVDDASE